jgi:AraC-like DNA-binding protein
MPNPAPGSPFPQTLIHPLPPANPIIVLHHTYRENQDAAFDMHYGLEVGLVLSGAMRRYYDGWQTNVTRGMVWLCGMWEPHGFSVVKAPCEALILVIAPELFSPLEIPAFNWLEIFAVPAPRRPQAGRAGQAAMLNLAHKIKTVADGSDPARPVWLKVLLSELLLTLQKNWQSGAAHTIINPSLYQRLQPVLQKVFTQNQAFTVQEAARFCGMSRNTFARHFVNLTGIAFADFSLRTRLKGAANQIVSTDNPLKAVAREWGFSDQSHLHKCFVRHFGCRPSDYRKQGGPKAPAQ